MADTEKDDTVSRLQSAWIRFDMHLSMVVMGGLKRLPGRARRRGFAFDDDQIFVQRFPSVLLGGLETEWGLNWNELMPQKAVQRCLRRAASKDREKDCQNCPHDPNIRHKF